MIDEIKAAALASGACAKVESIGDWTALIGLMFSPQGLEFCQAHNFPTAEVFREHQDDVMPLGLYVDAGRISLPRSKQVCLVGDTDAEIEASGVEYVHTIVLMHGARATVNATNYAVVKIVNISGAAVKINKDDTVRVL